MRLLTRLLAICGLPLGLFLVGCAVADEANFAPNAQACVTAADCSGGFVCLDFECTPPGPAAPELVSIELDPPDDSGYARTQLLDVPIDGLEAEPLELPMPTEYEAQITDAAGNPLSALLSFFGSPRIPGREIDVSATVAAGGAAPVFRLVEGAYVVRIRPNSAEVPGMEVTGFTVRPQPEPTVKQFALPREFRRLWGEVTSSVSNADKLAGVTVVAYGEKSGLASTVSVTDEYGNYELRLPATDDTTFRLVATPPSDAQPAWGFEQVVGGIDAQEGRQRAIRVEPTGEDVRGSARIQVLGTTSDGRLGAPVADAFVTLTATVTGVIEPPVYSVSGRTDADGVLIPNLDGPAAAQVPLLRARYVVRVVPPINTPYKSHRTVLDLTAAQSGFVLDEQVTLTERTRVEGVVRSALDRPVAGALVELLPLASDNRPADAVTDEDGRYSVALDPGPYLVVARALGPTDLGEEVPITAERVEVPDQDRLTLPNLQAAHGRAVQLRVGGAADGAPVPGTRVELFVRVDDQTVSLGGGETDANGTVTAVVPVSGR